MIELTSVEGNRQWLDGGAMFGNVPRALWKNWTQVDEQGRIPLACRCLLVEFENKKILCETGIGAFFEPKLSKRFGVENPESHELLKNLKSLGHDPESIDYVILSHLHFDHAGGMLPTYKEISEETNKLVFPKAHFLVSETAWKRALNPHYRDKASFIPVLNKLLEESGRLILVKNLQVPEELKGPIEFFESFGHTPGQMHTLIKGNKYLIVFAGDLIPGIPWVHLPITMGYDRYPEKLIEEKQALYEKFSGENFKIFFTHDPEFALGKLTLDNKGRYQVVEPESCFTRKNI